MFSPWNMGRVTKTRYLPTNYCQAVKLYCNFVFNCKQIQFITRNIVLAQKYNIGYKKHKTQITEKKSYNMKPNKAKNHKDKKKLWTLLIFPPKCNATYETIWRISLICMARRNNSRIEIIVEQLLASPDKGIDDGLFSI